MKQTVFEIDVSGQDIFDKDYTVVVAEKKDNGLLKGHKIDSKTINHLLFNWKQSKYRYAVSKKGKTNLRVRVYCIIIFAIFCELRNQIFEDKVLLEICRDFDGKEEQIKQSLTYFLNKISLQPEFVFTRLCKNSTADRYAYLLSKDTQNKFKSLLVKIKPEKFDELLK